MLRIITNKKYHELLRLLAEAQCLMQEAYKIMRNQAEEIKQLKDSHGQD